MVSILKTIAFIRFILEAHTFSIQTNYFTPFCYFYFPGENKEVDSHSVTLVAKTQTQQTSRVFVISVTLENNKAFSPAGKF